MEKKDHEFCLRCGRKLKNPIAREKGYGIICEKKVRIMNNHKLFKSDVTSDQENGDNLQSS